MDKAYEIFLGELVFSPNDPRVDIVENADKSFDPAFQSWLTNKIEKSTDPEEKIALKDLFGMITDVQEKIELSRAAQEREEAERAEAERVRLAEREKEMEEGRRLSDTDVLKRASAVDTAVIDKKKEEAAEEAAAKKTFYETELTPKIRTSYGKLLQTLLPPYKAGESPASVVFNNYSQFDAQLIKVLDERRAGGDTDAGAVLDALAAEQQKRVNAATERLKSVLAMGDPMRMEGAIVKLAKEDQIDEPFLLLLEANADQAERAGAQGPAQLMRKLKNQAMDEKDKQAQTKEIRLLRKLLRAADSQEREELLTDAFTPKEVFIVPGTMENAQKAADGEQPEQEKPLPDVPPPDFINACKAVLLNFGNLDDGQGDMSTRIKQIASEAEVVATRIYGKGMTKREQQDRMWKEETTSIFDLERMEIEAESMGDKAPWATKDVNDEILPGFDADGRFQVGGS
eukprot:CAMPEP_0172485114 /NCGR_PEP_ID=MMETSP1066-20121228/12921_1 /TAXON_ID=671091 /ORGANISM="Coscinodiscus wailesii, Strain CCMP2513" /LENGTH=457 /DNA_ID=CAMNT_0013250085 /DNA_START=340 /DNA_END=1713 /DNA_ORIENTATION=+